MIFNCFVLFSILNARFCKNQTFSIIFRILKYFNLPQHAEKNAVASRWMSQNERTKFAYDLGHNTVVRSRGWGTVVLFHRNQRCSIGSCSTNQCNFKDVDKVPSQISVQHVLYYLLGICVLLVNSSRLVQSSYVLPLCSQSLTH